MPFRPVPGRLGVRFSHEIGEGTTQRHIGYAKHKGRYVVTRATLQRPAKGEERTSLECGECGKRVDFRMLGSARTRRYRLLWLMLLLACPAAFIVVYSVTSGHDGAATWVLVLSIPLLLIAGVICAVVWWNEEGVRYRPPKIDSGPFHILEVGRMTASWQTSR